jgi:hypothetical protein
MCVAGSLAHLQFASTGWLYRYEAYLMVLGILVLGWTAGELLTRSRRWMALVLVVALAPATYRAGCAVGLVPQACKNLYEQQYQMGRFLHRYYQGATVAANDIGAINYLADIHCSDLMGLAHLEFARARHAQTYNTATIDELTRRDHVTIAIVFDSWFTRYGGLPASWLPVGKWEIPNCIWSEGAVVTFYATDAIEAGKLQAHLHEFAAELPKDVRRFAARPAGF